MPHRAGAGGPVAAAPRLLALLLAAVALSGCLPTAAAAVPEPQLSNGVLYKLLYQEPNRYLQTLGNISDTEGSLSRTFLSPAHRRAAGRLRRWMAGAGMRTWADQMANVHGRVQGQDPSAPVLMIGSHYDTVHDGGKYDGALGIIVGISAVKAVLLEAALSKGLVTAEEVEQAAAQAGPDSSIDLSELLYDQQQAAQLIATPVEVLAFADEEGVRFHSTYLGSRALVGKLLDIGILRNIDHAGVSVMEALEQAGFDPSPASLRKMIIPKDKIKAYVEVHMEQGPVLQSEGRALGPVAAIAGQTRLQAEIWGEQGHAGTVPMRGRRDPMAASAEIMAQLEHICNGGNRTGAVHSAELALDESLVCTVGSLSIWPNAGNVIPGNTNFTLDIRSRWDANRLQVIRELEGTMESVCSRRGLSCRLHLKNEAAAVESDPEVVQSLLDASMEAQPLMQTLFAERDKEAPSAPANACAAAPDGSMGPACGASEDSSNTPAAPASGGGGKPPVLVSGAGHDAMVFADVTKMGMLFVRCRDGISHSPLEYVSPDDVAAATATLYRYLRKELLYNKPA